VLPKVLILTVATIARLWNKLAGNFPNGCQSAALAESSTWLGRARRDPGTTTQFYDKGLKKRKPENVPTS